MVISSMDNDMLELHKLSEVWIILTDHGIFSWENCWIVGLRYWSDLQIQA